ncbi:MAG: dihydroneopterin aldolase [Rhodospirillales bacterium]
MAGKAWDPNRSHIRVMLRGVRTEAHVGRHAWERHAERPTRLIVDVDLLAPTDGATVPLIDYDVVRDALKSWPGQPHTELLETLAEQIVTLCFSIPAVQACRVAVRKPDIFNEADSAGIEIFRVRQA